MDLEYFIQVSFSSTSFHFIGYTINFIREVTFCSVYFGLYEHLKSFLHRIGNETFHNQNTTSGLSIVVAGGLSGVSGIE